MAWEVLFQLFDAALYRRVVEPACRSFVVDGQLEPIARALAIVAKRCASEASLDRLTFQPAVFTRENLDSARTILAERDGSRMGRAARTPRSGERDRSEFVLETVIPLLVEACVDWRSRIEPSQSMTSGALPELLSSHSEWLALKLVAGALEGGERRSLEFKHGVSCVLLSPRTLARADHELAAIPRPRDPVVRDELGSFRRLVRKARAGNAQGLVRTML